jgi:hypothetical protein
MVILIATQSRLPDKDYYDVNYFLAAKAISVIKELSTPLEAFSCLVEEIKGTRNDSSAGSRPGRQARGGNRLPSRPDSFSGSQTVS